MNTLEKPSIQLARLYDRNSGPRTLIDNGIPCIIWAEDALRQYNVPTVVFDLFCLVEDPQIAADCLRNHGFTELPENSRPGYQDMPELVSGRPRLSHRPEDVHDGYGWTPAIILLPIVSWNYASANLSQDSSKLYPSLPLLLKGLIDGWLNAIDPYYSQHIGVHIAYLYRYEPQLRETAFVDSLDLLYYKEYHTMYLERTVWEPDKPYFKEKRSQTVDVREQ